MESVCECGHYLTESRNPIALPGALQNSKEWCRNIGYWIGWKKIRGKSFGYKHWINYIWPKKFKKKMKNFSKFFLQLLVRFFLVQYFDQKFFSCIFVATKSPMFLQLPIQCRGHIWTLPLSLLTLCNQTRSTPTCLLNLSCCRYIKQATRLRRIVDGVFVGSFPDLKIL